MSLIKPDSVIEREKLEDQGIRRWAMDKAVEVFRESATEDYAAITTMADYFRKYVKEGM